MKRIANHLRTLLFASLAALPLLSTLSCDIGLGESVDTEAPALSIDYPKVGVVIRDSFVVKGTWSDDKSLSSLQISVQGTGTDNQNFALPPENVMVNPDGSWYAVLNDYGNYDYNGWKIPDGPIQITATAIDNSNHKTVVTHSVEIDNTPPVLILAKPLSTGKEQPSTFGRIVKLTGDIYDMHQSNGIKVSFGYASANGNTITGGISWLEGFTINSSMTDDTPLIIAQYCDPASVLADPSKAPLRNNYLQLYGSDADNGAGNTLDKTYYCTVRLSDSAKVYKNPGDSGIGDGNTASTYYINSNNFYNYLQSDKYGKNYDITATKIAKLINGTFNEPGITAKDKKEIFKRLAEVGNSASCEELDARRSSKMLINPDNSPTWNVSDYAVNAGTYNEYSNGAGLYVNVNAGKDGTLLLPETMKVVLKHKDKEGRDIDDIILCEAGEWDSTDAAASLSTTFQIQGSANHIYEFEVTGKDRDGNDVVSQNANRYAFRVKKTAFDPSIEVTSKPEFVTAKKARDEGIKIEGTVVFSNTDDKFDTDNPIEIEISKIGGQETGWGWFKPGMDENVVIGYENGTSTPVVNTWSVTIKGDKAKPLTGQTGNVKMDLNVKIRDNSGETDPGKLPVSVYIKNDTPTISFNTDANTYNIGSQFVITGSAKGTEYDGDTQMVILEAPGADPEFVTYDEEYYSRTGKKNKGKGDWTAIYTVSSTVAPQNKTGKASVLFTAKDEFGPSSTNSFGFNYDNVAPTVKITSVTPYVVNGTASDVNGKVTIAGTARDTSDIAKIVLKAKQDGAEFELETKTSDSGDLTNFEFVVDTMAQEGGVARFKNTKPVEFIVYAYDKTGWIIDSGAAKNKGTGNEGFAKTGNAESGHARAYTVNQESDRPVFTPSNFVLEKTEAELGKTRDENDRANIFGTKDNKYLTGIIKDDDGIAVVEVFFKANGESSWPADTPDNRSKNLYQKLSGNNDTNYQLNVPVPAVDGIIYDVKIVVTDRYKDVDNTGCAVYDSSKNDTVHTFIGVSDGAPALSISEPNGGFKKKNASITTSGTVKGNIVKFERIIDPSNNTEGVVIYENGTSKNGGSVGTADADNKRTWSDTFTGKRDDTADSDSYEVQYRATNQFNQASTIIYTYKVDTTAPTNDISTRAENTTGTRAFSGETSIRGTASDNTGGSGVVAVYYQVGSDTDAIPTDLYEEDNAHGWTKWDASGAWSIPLDFVDYVGPDYNPAANGGKFQEGKYKFFVYAVDGAGNASTVGSLRFDVNLHDPELTVAAMDTASTPAPVSGQINKPFRFNYTVTDTYEEVTAPEVTVEVYKGTAKLEASAYTLDTENKLVKINAIENETTTAPSNGIYTSDGTYYVVLKATDAFGKSVTVTSDKITIDRTKPSLPVISTPGVDASGNALWLNSKGNFDSNGTATDPNSGTGVKTVWFAKNGATQPALPAAADLLDDSAWTAKGWVKATGTQSWSSPVSGLTDGENIAYIYVAAVDNAGNVSAVASRSISVDTTAPVLANVKYNLGDDVGHEDRATDYDTEVTLNSNFNKFEIIGTYSDAISKVTINATCNGQAYDPNAFEFIPTPASGTDKSGTWVLKTKTTVSDGEYKIEVRASDKANNTAVLKRTIFVDTIAPAIDSFKYPTYSSTGASNTADTRAENYTLTGKITESGSGLKDRMTLWFFNAALGVGEYTNAINKSATQTAYKPIPSGWDFDAAKINGTLKRSVELDAGQNWNETISYSDTSAKTDENTFKEVFEVEGSKTVALEVTDNAGNRTVVIKNFVYDKALPALIPGWTEVPAFMPKNGNTFSGTAKDSYQLRPTGTVIIREKYYSAPGASPENASLTLALTQMTEVTQDKEYTVSARIPLNGAAVRDGTYTYDIEVYDAVGNVFNSQTYNLVADLTPPALAITTPSSDTSAKGVDAINVANYRFEGSSNDGTGTTSSGVTTVFYKINTNPTIDVSAIGSLYQDADHTNGWSTSVNGTPQSWNITQKFKDKGASGDGLEEGTYYLHAYCVDKAGNYSYDHETVSGTKDGVATRTFDVDLHNPTLTTNLGNTALTTNTVKTITEPAPLSFTISDTYGLDSTTPYSIVVKQTKTGSDAVTMGRDDSATPGPNTYSVKEINRAGGQYKIEINGVNLTGEFDALYEYSITAKDAFGKTTVAERSIRLDTQAPVLDITSHNFDEHGNSAWITGDNKFTVKGTATDDSGVVAVWYKKASGATLPSSGDMTLDSTWSGWTKTSGAANWTIPETEYADGLNYISYTAVDKNGLATAVKTVAFRVDKDAPVISGAIKMSKWDSTAASGAGAYGTAENLNDKTNTNVKFKLEGTVTDEYQLSGLKLELFKGSAATATYTLVDDEANANHLTMTKTSDKSWSWSYEFDPADSSKPLADGLWNFKLTATDAGGQSAVQTNKIVVDTIVPAAAIDYTIDSDVNFTDASGNKWYRSNQVTISLKAEDTTGADEVTGVASVEYSTNASATTPTWTPLAKVNGEYKGSVTVNNQGVNEISIRITDNAGNVNSTAGTLNPYVDTKSPGVPTDVTVDGESGVATKLVNGQNAVVVVMTGIADDVTAGDGTDSGIGASSVKLVKIGGTTLATPIAAVADDSTPPVAGKYTLTIPAANIASGQCTLEISDNVGNKTDYIPFTFDLDNVAPTVDLIAPSDADKKTAGTQVNASITVSGSTNDNKALNHAIVGASAITIGSPVFYYTATEPTGVTTATWSDKKSGWIKLADITIDDTGNCYSWVTKAIDTTSAGGVFADGTKYWLIAEVTDTALNTGVSNIVEFTVSQDTDRPIVKNTNLNNNGTDASPTYILSFGTRSQVEGSVEDDDGDSTSAVKAFFATEKAPKNVEFTDNETATVTYSDDSTEKFAYLTSTGVWRPTADNVTVVSGITIFDAKSGDYIYEPNVITDGQKSVWFVVRDNKDKIFWTAYASTPAVDADKLNRPKFQHKTSAAGDSATVFTYKVDGANPTVSGTSMSAKDSGGNDVDFSNGSAADPVTSTAIQDSVTLGGPDREKAIFSFNASDANGIEGMTLEMTFTGKFRKADGTEEDRTVTKKFATAEKIGSKFDDSTNKEYTVSGSMIQQKANPVASDPFTWTLAELTLHGASSIFKETESVACYGTIKFVVTAYDTCGNYSNNTYQCALDNVGPTINISSPDSTKEVTGKVTVLGNATDSGNAGFRIIRWAIPTTAQVDEGLDALGQMGDYNATTKEGLWRTEFTSSNPIAMSILFTSDAGAGNAPALENYDSTTYGVKDVNGIWTLPLYLKSVDQNGNISVLAYSLKHNPDGDKPVTTVRYPEYNNPTDTYITIGGRIRVNGDVEIPSMTCNAKRLFFQLGKAKTVAGVETCTFDETDKTWATGLKKGDNTPIYTAINYAGAAPDGKTTTGIEDAAEQAKWWGFEGTCTSASWSFILNDDGEVNPASGSSTTNNIAFRVCAVNENGKLGGWSKTYILHIDNQAPTSLYSLKQISGFTGNSADHSVTAEGTVTSSQAYESDKYLKGEWFIVDDIIDESGIEENTPSVSTNMTVKLDGSETTYYKQAIYEDSDDSNKIKVGSVPAGKNYKNGFRIYIPVAGADSTKLTYTINVVDKDTGNPHTMTDTFVLYRDNTAPTMGDFKFNGDDVTLTLDASDSTLFGTDTKISDSSYRFKVEGIAEDDGSKFSHVFFYYIRGAKISGQTIATSDQVFLDPVYVPGSKGDGTDDVGEDKVALSGLDSLTITQGTGAAALNYTVYGKTYTGTRSDVDKVTVSGISGASGNKHIRKGGMIYIDGAYRIITSLIGDTATFTPATADTTATQVTFVYGQVVDSEKAEEIDTNKLSNKAFVFKKVEDDYMPETVIASNGRAKAEWEATIHSSNLPDGPVTLIVLAFDKAGNVSGKKIDTFVSNNQPRIAKVYLGTDLDGNDVIDQANNEFVEYNWFENTDSVVNKKAIETSKFKNGKYGAAYEESPFKIKKDLAVVPEIVGGNGSVKMVFNNKAADLAADAEPVAVTGTGAALLAEATSGINITGVTADSSLKSAFKKFKLSNAQLNAGEVADGTDKNMSFTFWDETDLTTQGLNSQCAVLHVKDFNLDLVDDVKPNVYVDRFFWTSSEFNSLMDNSKENGHVELESDLAGGTWTGYTADAPKVSGKIVIRGTAYDDVRLKTINVQFGTAAQSGTNSVLAATYAKNATSGNMEWTIADLSAKGMTFRVYDNIGAAGATKMTGGETDASGTRTPDTAGNYFHPTNNFASKDSLAYFDQRGHKISWELTVDTQVAITSLTKIGVVAKVVALDSSDNTSDGRTARQRTAADEDDLKKDATCKDPTLHNDSYTMDVVPYITKVETALTKLSKKTPTMYSRTALGHYPVRVVTKTRSGSAGTSETVTISGFNLGTNTSVDVGSLTTSDDALTGGKSAPLVVTVAGVNSINNINNNNARGSYETAITDKSSYAIKNSYAYNRQPNNSNNNLLTDDVYFDVWEFNSQAAVPISGKIEQPVMKIRPTDGKIGFAFVNGPLYFSMGGSSTSQDYSYQYWAGSFDFFTSVGFAYDALGNSYGVAAGGDINSYTADKFCFMTSRFGIGEHGQNGMYNAQNALRLESIGYNIDGTPSFDKQRIKSPSLVTTVHDNATNVYLSYYDSMSDEVRFKAGTFNESTDSDWVVAQVQYTDSNGNGWRYGWVYIPEGIVENGAEFYFCDKDGNNVDAKDAAGNIVFASGTKHTVKGRYPTAVNTRKFCFRIDADNEKNAVAFPIGSYTQAAGGNQNRTPNDLIYVKIKTSNIRLRGDIKDYDVNSMYNYRKDQVSMIAMGDSSPSFSGGAVTRPAGEYVSLGVIPNNNDVVVATWYGSDRTLYYSYNTTPLIDRSGDTTFAGWSTPVAVFSGTDYDTAGEYCKVAVDANGGVHIAAYDPTNLDLCYAYLPSAKKGVAASSSDFKTCVVDANGVVGSNLTLDVALVGDKPVPYIGYYATSCIKPKYARCVVDLTSKSGDDIQGSIDDEVTGNWEISVVPSAEVIEMQSNQHNDINIGVWKNSGTLANSVTGTSATSNDAKGYNSTSYGQCYGNGTKNPVLGYAIKNGSSGDTIETAQMR